MSDRELRAAGMLVVAGVAAATVAVAVGLTSTGGSAIPRAGADPSTPTPSTTSASATPATPEFPSDDRGYMDSAARCDDGQTLLMFGRTSRSMVAVCVGPDGQLEYRGVRLNDDAGLTMSATRSTDGSIVATNDNVTYAITPQTLLVSEDDTVLYRDPWLEYHKVGLTPGSSAPSTTADEAPSATASTTSTTTTTTATVSTTTVTLAPTG